LKEKSSDSKKHIHQTWRERKGLQPWDTPLEDLPQITLTPNSEIERLVQKQSEAKAHKKEQLKSQTAV
jgi:hypothetical protein